MKIRNYSWNDFDAAVMASQRPEGKSLYGLPRGGLIFAVALSHKYNLPLIDYPDSHTILIDDIADKGKNIYKARQQFGLLTAVVLVKRRSCRASNILFIEEEKTEDWIVFPWENKEKTQEDYRQYISRK